MQIRAEKSAESTAAKGCDGVDVGGEGPAVGQRWMKLSSAGKKEAGGQKWGRLGRLDGDGAAALLSPCLTAADTWQFLISCRLSKTGANGEAAHDATTRHVRTRLPSLGPLLPGDASPLSRTGCILMYFDTAIPVPRYLRLSARPLIGDPPASALH